MADQVASAVQAVPTNILQSNLQDALAHLIQGAITAGQQGKDFIVGQLPDVIHQLLIYKATMSFIGFTIGVISAIISITLFTMLIKGTITVKKGNTSNLIKKDRYGDIEPTGIGFIWCFLIGANLVSAVAFIVNSLDWIEILVAPKFYLIDYAATLLRSLHGS